MVPAGEPPAGEDGNGKRTVASVTAALERRKYRSRRGDHVVTLNDVAYLVLPLGYGQKRRKWATVCTNQNSTDDEEGNHHEG